MPQLSVIDLAMFLLETPERPFNIGPLVLLRPPKGARRFADRLLERMLKQEAGPPFNHQLQLSLTRMPSVEPMPGADLAAHVHRLTLDGDGSMADLLAKVCELHEPLLPREGLLWQFYVIDGLADGRVALYGKVHHGIIDGRSFVQAVTQWFSTDPKDKTVRAMWQGLPAPDGARRAPTHRGARANTNAATLRALLKKATGVASSTLGLYRMLAAQGRRRLGLGGEALDLPFFGIPDALGGAVSAKRNYAFTTLPLAEVKSLGKAAGATVNDILLAVLDGALGRHLAAQSKGPTQPLVVDMPVALSGASGGNQIAVLQLAMGRPGSTPRQRLTATARRPRASRRQCRTTTLRR
ncbi:MAG: hypothetical protein IPP87_22350 [Ideonella sp.]|nr:hypothetical protein [Ideonella sp.]